MGKSILRIIAVPLVLLLWLLIEVKSLLVVILYLFRCELDNAKNEMYWEGPQFFVAEWFDEDSKWW